MRSALDRMLAAGIRRGGLRVTYADGASRSYGPESTGEISLRLSDPDAERALARDPAMALGELYADGRLVLESGSSYDLVATIKRNARHMVTPPAVALYGARYLASRLGRRQTVARARRNIAHHYDLDERFYRLFLDEDLQYTCAYFDQPDRTLEQAQLAKKRHVAAKLELERDCSVLDIGSGWGGLCLYLAEIGQTRATGVTLSRPQYEVAMRRARERDISERVDFVHADYHSMTGRFDRLVSVGMFEAIGRKDFDRFFEKAASLLTKKGVFLLHSIGRTKVRHVQSPWMDRYIFPGGYIPAISEVLPAVERAGFVVTDVEVLRLHYADTLREWRRRFTARRAEVVEIYDERFFRMWEFYLAVSEASFRVDRLFVFQLQLVRHQQAVPLTRDYIATVEAELRQRERLHDVYAEHCV